MKSVPLRFLASMNGNVLREDTPPDFKFRYVDISQVTATGGVEIPEDLTAFASAPSRARRIAQPGDTVVSTVRTYLRAVGQVPDAADPLVFSTGFAVLSPTALDPRFMAYACRSDDFIDEVSARSVGVSYPAINPSELMSIRLPRPAFDQQRRIADFLDDRVARIDRIITARRKQAEQLDLWTGGVAASLIQEHEAGSQAALSFLARIVDTEHRTAPTVPGGRCWVAGTGAVRHGRLLVTHLRETDAESYVSWTERGIPQVGDVLLTREAPVGEVALLAPSDPKVAIGQRVVLLKAREGALDPRFLRLVLMAGSMRQVIDRASAGSLHPHLNMAEISRLPIPLISMKLQAAEGARHSQLLADQAIRSLELAHSIDLLTEYKQSLITAAVTGELDVTIAGSGIPA